jgi:hypothetical protein
LKDLGKKKQAKEARKRAVEIVQGLAAMIPDEAMRRTYLDFVASRGARI